MKPTERLVLVKVRSTKQFKEGDTLRALVRLDSDYQSHPYGRWTVVATFESPELARLRFLMPEAPQEELRPGIPFELFEGTQQVATIVPFDEDQTICASCEEPLGEYACDRCDDEWWHGEEYNEEWYGED